jgi:hypothetical protein
MIISNKHSGYQAGIRIYPFGGGGGGGGESAPAPVAPPPPRLPSAAPAPQFQTFGQGDRTGSLVQSGAGMRPSSLDYSRPIFDPNYKDNITGYEQSSQFYQPIYQSQYQNFARPTTQFDVSTYGTQPVQSPASASGMSRGNINSAIGNYFQQNPNSAMGDTLNAMRNSGINRTDIQAFGGFNNYGPQMSTPQAQQPFNPYTNSFGGFGGGFMPQMQTPFRQPMQQFQPQFMPQMQQFQPQMGMGMQTPFSSGMSQPPRTSSGPAQAIVGRSSQMRGTPNVMRRAEGGIASLMDEA